MPYGDLSPWASLGATGEWVLGEGPGKAINGGAGAGEGRGSQWEGGEGREEGGQGRCRGWSGGEVMAPGAGLLLGAPGKVSSGSVHRVASGHLAWRMLTSLLLSLKNLNFLGGADPDQCSGKWG